MNSSSVGRQPFCFMSSVNHVVLGPVFCLGPCLFWRREWGINTTPQTQKSLESDKRHFFFPTGFIDFFFFYFPLIISDCYFCLHLSCPCVERLGGFVPSKGHKECSACWRAKDHILSCAHCISQSCVASLICLPLLYYLAKLNGKKKKQSRFSEVKSSFLQLAFGFVSFCFVLKNRQAFISYFSQWGFLVDAFILYFISMLLLRVNGQHVLVWILFRSFFLPLELIWLYWCWVILKLRQL